MSVIIAEFLCVSVTLVEALVSVTLVKLFGVSDSSRCSNRVFSPRVADWSLLDIGTRAIIN